MKESKKSLLKDGFGSLISNERAISAAKTSPIWLTILLFFVAIILPIIPITVTTARSYGSSFISNLSYGTEKTLPKLALDMAKDNRKLVVDENHLLSVIQTEEADPAYTYTNAVTEKVEMKIYFSSSEASKEKEAFISQIASSNKHLLTEATDDTDAVYYASSYVIFFRNGIYANIYAPDSMTQIAYSSQGDFKSIAPGTDLVELLMTNGDSKFSPTSDAEILAILSNSDNQATIFKNWKTIFDKSYITLRTRSTWIGSLIYLGVFAGLSLIMSFLIWVLTRGKNNPFSYLSIIMCWKIGTWSSICPGLLGCLLGLIFPQYAVMIFIMTMGLRTMWLSMRQLRPQYQE